MSSGAGRDFNKCPAFANASPLPAIKMEISRAKYIGSRQALKGVISGLIIAYLIMMWFSQGFGLLYALSWIKNVDYKFNLLVGVITIFISGYFLGQRAGLDILINKKKRFWTGVKYGFLIVLAATVLGSIVGVLEHLGIDDNVFFNYMVKPIFWVTFFGFTPIIVVGLWFGNSIYKKSSKT